MQVMLPLADVLASVAEMANAKSVKDIALHPATIMPTRLLSGYGHCHLQLRILPDGCQVTLISNFYFQIAGTFHLFSHDTVP